MTSNMKLVYIYIRTDGCKQAHDQQDDDAPEDVYIHLSLQFAALVTRAVVVEHGFGFVPCRNMTDISERHQTTFFFCFLSFFLFFFLKCFTCINDDPDGLLRVADGAASQQQVVFVKCIFFTAAMNSAKQKGIPSAVVQITALY